MPVGRFSLSVLIGAAAFGPAPAAQAEEDEARLDTVTVTAQRFAEDAQDVPISITAVSGEKLANISGGGADIRFLSARIPSVNAESSFGRTFPRFYIRGIGNTDFDLNSSQPISLVYDGVPLENPIVKGFPVFDIEQIEVLRGPQGTLFGRNTPGGIIKFDSVKPSEETSGYARVSLGSFETLDAEGAVGGKIFDGLSGRISGLYQRRNNFVDNDFTGEADALEGFEEIAGRGQLLFAPDSGDVSVLMNFHARTLDGTARLFRANIIDQGERGLGENFRRFAVENDGANEQRLDAWGMTINADWRFTEGVTGAYILGYEEAELFSVGDVDGGVGAAFLPTGSSPGVIPFPSETAGGVDDVRQITHELRAAYDRGGRIRGQAGVFFFDETVNIDSLSFDTLGGGVLNGESNRRQVTDAYGLFGSLSLDVTERLTVAGGVRYTRDDKDFTAERILSPIGAGPLAPQTVGVTDDEVSWDASATYAATDDVNVYARVARGFRAPSVQGRLLFGDAVSTADSETVISYEGGVKSELWDGRVRANLSGFYFELNDQQITSVGGADNTVALFNAEEGVGYGFEADLEAAPLENLLVTAGLSYNFTEIRDPGLLIPICGSPCTVLDPIDPVTGAAFVDGNPFPNAPEWIANATARYAYPVEGGEIFVFTDWAYKGAVNFFFYDSIEFAESGFWEGGARLGYQGDNGFHAAVFARNITDRDALKGGVDFNNLTGFVNEPRTWGVEVGFAY
ncbi:MAG: TonB-dependent receptor [Pseudomonadota bacterium]